MNLGFGYSTVGGIQRVAGRTWQRSTGYSWSWIGLDAAGKLHSETFHEDGSKTVVTCPSNEECEDMSEDAVESLRYIELRKEMRAAASTVYSLFIGSTDGDFDIERELRMKDETQFTISNGESPLVLKVENSDNYRHSFGVEYVVDGERIGYYVIVLTNQDGSFTTVVADTQSFIFLEGLTVKATESDYSIGGYSYSTKIIQFTDKLERYFASVREQSLKKWGIWDQWVRIVTSKELHDPQTDTTHTVYTYSNCLSGFDKSYKYEITVVESNTTVHHIEIPGVDVFAEMNTTNTSHSANTTIRSESSYVKTKIEEADFQRVFANNMTFRLYDGGKITFDNSTEDVVCVKGGIDCLQKWLTLKFTTTTLVSNFTIVHFKGQKYFWYHNREDLLPESSGTVTDEEGNVVTQEGITGLRKAVEPAYRTYYIKSTEYREYKNGSVTDIKGNVIAKTGGIDTVLTSLKPKFTHYQVNGESYNIFQSGRVADSDDNTVLEEGGIFALLSQIAEESKDEDYEKKNSAILLMNGEQFTYFSNGTIYDKNGLVVVKTGGIEAMQAYYVPYNITNINGEDFKIYRNGTVTNLKGEFVIDGGLIALKNWFIKSHNIDYKIIDTCIGNSTFKLFNNGTVTTFGGTFVSDKGAEYFEELCSGNRTIKTQIVKWIYYFNKYYFIYEDGSVYDKSVGELVCTEGGEACLEEYIIANDK